MAMKVELYDLYDPDDLNAEAKHTLYFNESDWGSMRAIRYRNEVYVEVDSWGTNEFAFEKLQIKEVN